MNMEKIIDKTIDNGTIENIHIAPIGEFYGSTRDGEPVKENLDVESLKQLADQLNSGDEILLDVDHASERLGANRSTEAAGWLHKFIVDPIKGLFATLKLTKKGKELLENREYRYTSPVFELAEDGKVLGMRSVALTNAPAFKGAINPILNSMPEDQAEKKDIMEKEEIKEELKEEVKEEIVEKTEDANEVVEEVKDDKSDVENTFEKIIQRLDVVEAKVDEIVQKIEKKDEKGTTEGDTEAGKAAAEATAKEVIETVVDAENACSEKKEAENACSEKKEEEVIKLDALNTAPVSLGAEPEWKNLHGQKFFDWVKKNYNF